MLVIKGLMPAAGWLITANLNAISLFAGANAVTCQASLDLAEPNDRRATP